MERNTLTTIKEVQIGDRFYKVGDPKKTLYTLTEAEPQKTFFQTYKHFAVKDGEKHKQAFKAFTQVVFLRNINNTQ